MLLKQLKKLTAFGACALLAVTTSAQNFPSKTVRIILPFSAGGSSDVAMRAIAAEMSKGLGQSVIVENKPGAGGVVGAIEAIRHPSDGYTLLAGNAGTHIINPMIKNNLGYDPSKDFTPIAMVQSMPMFLVAHPGLGVKSLQEFIALAKSKPDQITVASQGNGHSLGIALLGEMADVKLRIIPYNGPGPALADTLAGHVDAFLDSGIAVMPQVKAGKINVLGTSSLKRVPRYPDIPAIAETYPGYEIVGNTALYAAGRIPPESAKRLTEEAQRAIATPQVAKVIHDGGGIPINGNGTEVAKWMTDGTEVWKRVIQTTGVVLR